MSDLPQDVVDQVAQLSDHFGADPLDPELEDYVIVDEDDGSVWIKHPLVFSMMHVPMLNRIVNAQLAAKRAVIAEYLAASNWRGYILAHERPYRMDALMDACYEVTHKQWWSLVAFVWSDSENIREYQEVWDVVLRQDRPERHAMMQDFEREDFNKLSKVIDVYQGCTQARDDGWSWTTDRAKALWFAKRFAQLERAMPVLRWGRVDKSDVTAYLTRRNESEIIVAPELVHDVRAKLL